ncbi:hypothetical protein ACIRD3_16465 [Kitasatospora sp. NPDC093550]|uniref:hypothetical protein n=1 Tax=Kitasatospora sp. NPDC093550 TaxID=3364089 RepID=UPI003817F150
MLGTAEVFFEQLPQPRMVDRDPRPVQRLAVRPPHRARMVHRPGQVVGLPGPVVTLDVGDLLR